MLLSLILAAFAADPTITPVSVPQKATATTVAGLTAAQVTASGERAWATFPTTISGASVTVTVKCVNGAACTVLNNTTKVGTATIEKVQTGGFILNSSLSSGGTSWIVQASWKPDAAISAVVQSSAIPAH